MFILTSAKHFENCNDSIYRVRDAVLEKNYLDAGYHQHERSYKVKSNYKEYTIICPEFRSSTKGTESVIILPEFLVPGRPYPVYVYMYAIDIYSNAPEKGQRWAAEKTRKKFRLASFAHTTLGRALKSFTHTIGKFTGTTADSFQAINKPGFPSTQSTTTLRSQASQFIKSVLPRAERQQPIVAYGKLAAAWFREHIRFLL